VARRLVPISTIIGGERQVSTPSAVWDNPMSAFGGKADRCGPLNQEDHTVPLAMPHNSDRDVAAAGAFKRALVLIWIVGLNS
jgi:hypothetical protein